MNGEKGTTGEKIKERRRKTGTVRLETSMFKYPRKRGEGREAGREFSGIWTGTGQAHYPRIPTSPDSLPNGGAKPGNGKSHRLRDMVLGYQPTKFNRWI